jgi:hypothetical protein
MDNWWRSATPAGSISQGLFLAKGIAWRLGKLLLQDEESSSSLVTNFFDEPSCICMSKFSLSRKKG